MSTREAGEDTERYRNEVYLALARSVLYDALALGFRPPTAGGIARLAGAGGCAALADAATECGSGTLAIEVAALAASATENLEDLTARHRRLFGHTVRGRVPLYDTEYGEKNMFQQPQELADLAGFLGAFGLALKTGEQERIDHLSCECEFMACLSRKEAHALEVGDAAMREETVKAERLFLRDHLARFTPAVARALEREDVGGFYGALGALLLAFVGSECGRLDVRLGSPTLRLRVEVDDSIPMAVRE